MCEKIKVTCPKCGKCIESVSYILTYIESGTVSSTGVCGDTVENIFKSFCSECGEFYHHKDLSQVQDFLNNVKEV